MAYQTVWAAGSIYTDGMGMTRTNSGDSYYPDVSTTTYEQFIGPTRFETYETRWYIAGSLQSGYKGPALVITYQTKGETHIAAYPPTLQISTNSAMSWTTMDTHDMGSSWTEVRTCYYSLTNSLADNLPRLRVRIIGGPYNSTAEWRMYSVYVEAFDPTPMLSGYIVGQE